MKLFRDAARDADLRFESETASIEPAGVLVIVDGELALPVRGKLKRLGGTKLGEASSGTINGSLLKGFTLKSEDGWSATTRPREMCLDGGVERFLKQRDPSLDGHQ